LLGGFNTGAGDFFADAAFKALLKFFDGFEAVNEWSEVDVGFATQENDEKDYGNKQ